MAAIELASLSLFNDANLQAYYKLENANDNKNSNNLTNENSVAFNAAKFNNGADTGSSDGDKVLYRNDANGYTNGAYSTSLWVKLNTDLSGADATYQFINVYTSNSQWLLGYYRVSGVNKIFYGRYNGTTTDTIEHTVTLGTSNFHHIVMTHDGTSIRAYYDGALVGGPLTATGTGGSFTPIFVIGGNGNVRSANNALAIFDDVAVFTRELTAAEVLQIYGSEDNGGYIFQSY